MGRGSHILRSQLPEILSPGYPCILDKLPSRIFVSSAKVKENLIVTCGVEMLERSD